MYLDYFDSKTTPSKYSDYDINQFLNKIILAE